jgi:hypothetical protein
MPNSYNTHVRERRRIRFHNRLANRALNLSKPQSFDRPASLVESVSSRERPPSSDEKETLEWCLIS